MISGYRNRRDIESVRYSREPQDANLTRYAREPPDATLTAASLIDAIITHQINQPSAQESHSPSPVVRTGDRLFASFQRSIQPPSFPTEHQIPFNQVTNNAGNCVAQDKNDDELKNSKRSPQGNLTCC